MFSAFPDVDSKVCVCVCVCGLERDCEMAKEQNTDCDLEEMGKSVILEARVI